MVSYVRPMKTGLEESAIEIEKRETSEGRTRLLSSFNLCELESATCLYSSNKKNNGHYFLISGVAKKVHV